MKMKTRFISMLLCIVMVLGLISGQAFAADIVASGYCGGEGDGTNLTWTLDSDGTLTISGTGEMKNYSYSGTNVAPWYSDKSSMRALIIEHGVTSIGHYAFYYCSGFTGPLKIPNSVTSIGRCAFYRCSSFTGSLMIPNSVTFIGEYAFYGCSGFTGSLTIPNSVTSIGEYAFYDCSGFTGSLTIPDSVTSIGDSAFAKCTSFTGSLTIGNSVTSIGAAAFDGCRGFTGSLTIPDSVTSIEFAAFYDCSGFTGSLTIPNSVTSIGGSAFWNCSGFTGSLTIPNSVTSIGSHTFSYCSSFTGSLTIPNSVTSIGNHAFYGCSGFTGSLTIPNSMTSIRKSAFYKCSGFTGSLMIPDSVTTIGDSAFYGCEGFIGSLTIPNSVTSIGVEAFYGCSGFTGALTIGNSVASIGSRAFYRCSGFTGFLTLPDSVASIGQYAFYRCSNLESACFCDDAPSMGGTAFANTKSSFTVYYVPGTSGWTDSDAYDAAAGTWNGYPLKTWNGKALPAAAEVSVPKGKYCIQVIDGYNAPISGATVTWDSSSASTDQDGNAFFDLMTVGSPVIQVSKADYLTWTNQDSNWEKNDKHFERVILYPTSYGALKLKSAKISGCDLLTQTKVLNLKNDGALIGDLNSGLFDLTCTATTPSEVVGYAIFQNEKRIGGSADGKFHDLNVKDFSKGGGCFIRVTGKDGRIVDTHINLQFEENSVNEEFGFELKGNKISFMVSDDVPFVGGSTVSFELPTQVPAVVSVTEDKVQIGINLKLNENESKEEQISNYKKMIRKALTAGRVDLTEKNVNALKNCAAQHNKGEFFKKCEFTFCGYAEASPGSRTASGYLMIIAKITVAEFEYNTVVWVAPVTVQIGVDFSLEAGGMVRYSFDAQEWNGNIFLNPSFGLKAFAGVGYSKFLGAGAYGNADLAAKWNVFGTNSGLQSVDLTGELGIKAYIGVLEAHKAFAHQTWHLYKANSVQSLSLQSNGESWNAPFSASDMTVSDLGYMAEESEWSPQTVQLQEASARTSYQTLLADTYRNAQPVMISDGSALYAAFVRADADSGVRYVAVTKFDGTSWCEPVRVDASAILDDAPQLCADGNGNLWLAYARTTGNPGESLLTYAQNQAIVVGTIDKDTLAFTEQKTYCSGVYMHLPTLDCVDGTPVLAWVDSAVTDEASVLQPNSSSVFEATYLNGAWTEAQETETTSAVVTSLCIGVKNGAPAVAYTAGGQLCWNGSILVENVIGKVAFGRLPGTSSDSFLWIADSALHNEAGDVVPAEGMGREFAIVGSSIYYNKSNGANANLAVLQYDSDNDHWGAPICLIGDEKYLENMSVASLNGNTYAFGMHTTATITQDAVDDAKDLVWTSILPVSDLKIQDISFDSSELVPGEELPVTITVSNVGDHGVTSLTVSVDGSEIASPSCSILPGESTEITVNISCPSEKKTILFDVQEHGEDDYVPEDNELACTIGSADAELELSLLQIGGQRSFQATAVNHGLEAASGSILFCNSNGQVLAERTFENLVYGDVAVAVYTPEAFGAFFGEDVTATVTLAQEEPYTLNNSDSVPVLIPATEITVAYRSGNEIKAEATCMQDTTAIVYCAFYDQNGKMLGVDIQKIEPQKSTALSFAIEYPNAVQATLFLLDGSSAPVCTCTSVALES